MTGDPHPELLSQGESGSRSGIQAAGEAPCSLLTSSWPGQLLAVLCFGTALLLALAALVKFPDTVGEAKVPLVGFWICLRLWPRSGTGLGEHLATLLACSYFLFDLWPLANSGNNNATILVVLLGAIILDDLTALTWARPSWPVLAIATPRFDRSGKRQLNAPRHLDPPTVAQVGPESKS